MDLERILANVEGKEEIIKQINAEIGKDFVPREEFNRKNDEFKAASKQIKDQEDALKNVGEYKKQIEELTGRVSGYELNNLKTRIALENGIPYDMISRIQGEDEESIRKDAVTLSEYFRKDQPAPPLKSTEKEPVTTEQSAYRNMLENLDKGE